MPLPLDPQLVFDRFVVGPANGLAAAAARRAAESPGRSYNPLVICGPSGLGKTHLLGAIGHLARTVEPELLVRYEPMENFVDRLTASIAGGTLEELREATGQVGLLLLDDVQHAAGKARTQEELLRLLEERVQLGAQVVVACDRPPHEIPAFDSRLATRLAAGLVVDIAPPDEATRLAILRRLLEERGAPLPAEVLQVLSRLPIQNVRELQGALNRIMAAVEIEERDVTPADVPTLLGLESTDERRADDDEFGGFLSDISTAVAAVVETAPWRRRIAQAILRWEGEGIRTRRLEDALDADSAPDVDALLDAFARDVARLRQLRRELPDTDPALFTDPDRLAEAEALLAARQAEGGAPQPKPQAPLRRMGRPGTLDRWFLDTEKLAWNWVALDERLTEEQG